MEQTHAHNSDDQGSDESRLNDVMSITQDNYANMLKRLDRNRKFSNFVLTYYSITLIVYSVTAKFFPKVYCNVLSDYFCIIISVVVLAYSLINSNANYHERQKNAERILNQIKDIRRGMKREENEVERGKLYESYKKITSDAEYRSDVDFFRTIKQRCKKYHVRWYNRKIDDKSDNSEKNSNDGSIEKIEEHLSEISPYFQQLRIISEYALMVLVVLLPLVLFIMCFRFDMESG